MLLKMMIAALLAVLAVGSVATSHADMPPAASTVVLTPNETARRMDIHIWLTPDGRSYVIDSATPLEVGESVCQPASGNPNELICQAPLVLGFLVNAGTGDDMISVARSVAVPVTLNGAAGDDLLIGAGGSDKLIGGPGKDRLGGRAGDDVVYGGPGNDVLWGGPGDDVLRGGPGRDALHGGSGNNALSTDTSPPSQSRAAQ